jgi:thiamine-phosphate pyrophosphorylase
LTLPRFYPVLDTQALHACGIETVAAAGALLEAGAAILQLRHKDNYTRAAFADAETVAGMCRDAGALLVVNDRADIARLLDAGLHLGQDDLTPELARTICGGETFIGFSTHNEEQLREAEREPVDYLALGPIFGTASKSNPDPIVGVAELRRLRPLTPRPLVAIGGITMDNAGAVFEAGANAVAVIGDLLNGVENAGQLRARTEEWLRLTNRQKR